MKQFDAIIIGGSAGSFQVIADILSGLPTDFNLPVILCFHRLRTERYGFVEALRPRSVLPIIEPLDKTKMVGGIVYLAPANYHLYIEKDRHIVLSVEEPENHSRPSIDLCFYSASLTFKNKLLAILLSGANSDGTKGIISVKEQGGHVIVQDPAEAEAPLMPKTAINAMTSVEIKKTREIVSFLAEIT